MRMNDLFKLLASIVIGISLGVSIYFLFMQKSDQKSKKEKITEIKKALPGGKAAAYLKKRAQIAEKYKGVVPRFWGERVPGVVTHIKTNEKIIALTLDACGGKTGSAYDKDLIDYLVKNKVQATLFLNARWIDRNLDVFMQLAANNLFNIANHGWKHRPASVNGKKIYGQKGTKTVAQAVDEIEINAIKIESLTGARPIFYRSGTAYYDEVATKVANDLKHQVINFNILSGDANPFLAQKVIYSNLVRGLKPGAIIICHMNHPIWNTKEALIPFIELAKKQGYRFVKLSDYKDQLYTISRSKK